MLSVLKWLIRLALVCLVCGSAFSVNAFTYLTFQTEEYPPYNFTDNGPPQGISVDLLLAAAKQTGNPLTAKKIKVLPWARGYKNTVKGPSMVLFATTRTDTRESLFKWVGPIAPTRIVLLAKKVDNISLDSIEDAKKYKIGVVNEDVGEQLLLAAGFTYKQLKGSSKPAQVAKKLASGRLKIWAYEESVARWLLKKSGEASEKYVVVYVLKEAKLFYALSKDVPQNVVQAFQAAIDEVKHSGEYNTILNHYR